MIDISWQKERLDAHERYIDTARKHVAEAEEQVHVLARENREGHKNEASIAIAEQVLRTNQDILREMESHRDYVRSQFAYLNSLEERRAKERDAQIQRGRPKTIE
jgi:hypothetical protein